MKKENLKFIEYLKEQKEKKLKSYFLQILDTKDLYSELELLSFLIDYANYLSNGISEKPDFVVFNKMNLLSKQLVTSHLNKKERTNIILQTINSNISKGILISENLPVIIESEDFPEMSPEEILESERLKRIQSIFESDDDSLTPKQLELKRHLIETTDNFVNSHAIVKESLLDKINDYNEEDIERTINAFSNLHINNELCEDIKYTLEQQLRKREKAFQDKMTPILRPEKPKESNYISDKDYKVIRKEISSYFDLYKMQPKKTLTEEERLYCANLLLMIENDPTVIENFFFRTDPELDWKNPIGIYNQNYDKIYFYQDKADLAESRQNIEAALTEMFITSDEDYAFWKTEISSELRKIISNIPNKHEYEIEKAKKFTKQK